MPRGRTCNQFGCTQPPTDPFHLALSLSPSPDSWTDAHREDRSLLGGAAVRPSSTGQAAGNRIPNPKLRCLPGGVWKASAKGEGCMVLCPRPGGGAEVRACKAWSSRQPSLDPYTPYGAPTLGFRKTGPRRCPSTTQPRIGSGAAAPHRAGALGCGSHGARRLPSG